MARARTCQHVTDNGLLSDNEGRRMGNRGRARLLAREVSKSIQQADVSQEGEGKGSRYGKGLRSRARGCRSYPTPKLSPRFGRRHTGTRRVTGVFKKWQSLYAEKGIATFPVNDNKKPCTKGYDKAHQGQAKIKLRLIADLDPDEWDLPPKPKWMRWSTI